MLTPLPAVLRYRAENFPEGFAPHLDPEGLLELHQVTTPPKALTCVQVFHGADALHRARKRAWELYEALGDAATW